MGNPGAEGFRSSVMARPSQLFTSALLHVLAGQAFHAGERCAPVVCPHIPARLLGTPSLFPERAPWPGLFLFKAKSRPEVEPASVIHVFSPPSQVKGTLSPGAGISDSTDITLNKLTCVYHNIRFIHSCTF